MILTTLYDLVFMSASSLEGETKTECNAGNMPLNGFLSSVEKPAYHHAYLATMRKEDALDIVQDSMLKLVEKYRHKPEEEWRPLFYKILYRNIVNWHRKSKLNTILGIIGFSDAVDADIESVDAGVHSSELGTPSANVQNEQLKTRLNKALKQLPLRQQQAVLLRSWHGFSTAETAKMMHCSEGSVKTHCSRGQLKLRGLLEDFHL